MRLGPLVAGKTETDGAEVIHCSGPGGLKDPKGMLGECSRKAATVSNRIQKGRNEFTRYEPDWVL
jgi:hypothetical protein